MDIAKIIQGIQYVLAPAIMVSSSALLLLGFQNKFSNLANRFRVLNQEKRALSQKVEKHDLEGLRLKNLEEQVGHLMQRATCVKNAIILTYTAIVCFTMTSVFIFLNVYAYFYLWHLIIAVFLVGLLFIFLSAIFMIQETQIFYKVISLERKS